MDYLQLELLFLSVSSFFFLESEIILIATPSAIPIPIFLIATPTEVPTPTPIATQKPKELFFFTFQGLKILFHFY